MGSQEVCCHSSRRCPILQNAVRSLHRPPSYYLVFSLPSDRGEIGDVALVVVAQKRETRSPLAVLAKAGFTRIGLSFHRVKSHLFPSLDEHHHHPDTARQ